MHIRPATKADCEQLFHLIQELALFEKAPEKVTVSFDHFVESGFGPRPVWWAFAATTPDSGAKGATEKIIGFALYYIRYSTWKGQRMYLEDLIVSAAHRRKGIGTLLFDRLLIEAREKKLNGISWQVLDWNESAINFYKKYNATFDYEWANGDILFQ